MPACSSICFKGVLRFETDNISDNFLPYCFAAAFTPASAHGARLLDGAGLLDEYSAEAVTGALDRMSEQLKMELVIVTTDSTDGREPRDYAADIYDYGDYGYNTTNDGIVLLIVMDDRYVGMTSTGKGRSVYTASVQNDMRDVITPYLRDGNYERAFFLCSASFAPTQRMLTTAARATM